MLIVPPRRLGRPAPIDSAAVAYEFKLPDLGEGLTEGEIARWLVAGGPGDRRGRPAGRGADRQDDGRDPLAGGRQGRADPGLRGRRRAGRNGARRDRRGRRRARRRSAADPQPDSTGPRPRDRHRDRGPNGTCPRDAARSGGWLRSSASTSMTVEGTGPAGTGDRGRRRAGPRRGRPRDTVRRTARAAARRPPPRRRAHEPRPPRGAARHLGRGVRLLERRAQAARPDACSRRSPRACRSSRS